MSWKQYFKEDKDFRQISNEPLFLFDNFQFIVREASHLQIVKSQNNYLAFYFQVQVVMWAAWMSFCFLSKIKIISSRLKPLWIKTVDMHSFILITVLPLELVGTYTSQTTQTPISPPSQGLVVHTNLLQATLTTLPTPKLFWLALSTSLHLK